MTTPKRIAAQDDSNEWISSGKKRDIPSPPQSPQMNRLENYLEDLLEASFDGIVISDADGNVLFANKAYEALSGIHKEEIVGHNLGGMIEGGILKGAAVFEVTKNRLPITRIHSYDRTGREAMVTGSPVFDEEGNLIYVVANFRDITLLRKFGERLGRSTDISAYPEKESLYLKTELAELPDYGILVRNQKMKAVLQQAIRVAKFDADVLILGESGVGKSKMAQIIHQASSRLNKPFISLNCGAIPENLLESELFGYERGAFTGARLQGKPGQFELASGGTLVLEEIGDLNLSLQVKLLKAIEEKQILKIGASTPLDVDTRIIATTHQDLKQMVQKGSFRKDLYFRLTVVPILIPPLKERRDEIPLLIRYFFDKFNGKYGTRKSPDPRLFRTLGQYDYPGNIRELKNLVERLVIMSPEDLLKVEDLEALAQDFDYPIITPELEENQSLAQFLQDCEKRLLGRVLREEPTLRQAALRLRINSTTLWRKLKRYRLLKKRQGYIPGGSN